MNFNPEMIEIWQSFSKKLTMFELVMPSLYLHSKKAHFGDGHYGGYESHFMNKC